MLLSGDSLCGLVCQLGLFGLILVSVDYLISVCVLRREALVEFSSFLGIQWYGSFNITEGYRCSRIGGSPPHCWEGYGKGSVSAMSPRVNQPPHRMYAPCRQAVLNPCG